ncbi:MAG: nucleotidyltransferase [Sphingobacteriales bacterium]|uniref:nucleotidyltransferase family protein n=1 Tax=Hydrotalea flava TaxID=714549 RepID=UPI0008349DC5|nr:nucleotidyltransferase family protein [Hydrotalea flava]RTL53179.1 MAG: nucleotidyltransferase [Sphingobacteriales bacterium]
MNEAIILAGGIGTRLKSAVPDLPKCMAPVNGKPFIAYIIAHLQQQGIDRFIFSLGYKHQYFTEYLQQHLLTESYTIVTEQEPLGTGGAIQLACSAVHSENVLVTNGDTLYTMHYATFRQFHLNKKAGCSLCLKPMEHFDRYGAVSINENSEIIAFHEKKYTEKGLINGGVYLLNVTQFLSNKLPEKFSFEKDYLEQKTGNRELFGYVQDEYFIDIGIPDDYLKAQAELS